MDRCYKELFVSMLLSAVVDYMSNPDGSKYKESAIEFLMSPICELGLSVLNLDLTGKDIISLIESGVVDLDNVKAKIVAFEVRG